VILVPPLFGFSFRESFLRAMTLLVAASPCALALGTPSAILAGVAQAARNGVLVKGGAHLENLGRLKAIAFDKTGTVTHGRPEVTICTSSCTSDRPFGSCAGCSCRYDGRG
jgi:Cd2+/Zn2+-exporting ATPase